MGRLTVLAPDAVARPPGLDDSIVSYSGEGASVLFSGECGSVLGAGLDPASNTQEELILRKMLRTSGQFAG